MRGVSHQFLWQVIKGGAAIKYLAPTHPSAWAWGSGITGRCSTGLSLGAARWGEPEEMQFFLLLQISVPGSRGMQELKQQ